MEAVKTWAVVLTALAAAFFAATAYQQSARLEELQAQLAEAKASPPPEPVQTAALPAGITEPSEELLAMTAQRDRFRSGLERCVGELNSTTALASSEQRAAALEAYILGTASTTGRGTGGASEQGQADIVLLGEVTSLPSGDSVRVAGAAYNRGAAPGVAEITIALFKDGVRLYTAREKVAAAAGQAVDWAHVFPHMSPEGGWSAQARVEQVITSTR